MKEILLTQDKSALVDDADFEWLRQWRWHTHKRKSSGYHAIKNQEGFAEMGRLLLGITDPKVRVRHLDRDGLNNQRRNLCVLSDEESKAAEARLKPYCGASLFRRRFDGRVYFIRAGGYVKIGVAADVQARMNRLQVGCPTEMELIASVATSDPYRLEAILHKRLRRCRFRGEWFHASDLMYRLLRLLRRLLPDTNTAQDVSLRVRHSDLFYVGCAV